MLYFYISWNKVTLFPLASALFTLPCKSCRANDDVYCSVLQHFLPTYLDNLQENLLVVASPPVIHGSTTCGTVRSVPPNAKPKPPPSSCRTDATIALVQCTAVAGRSEAAGAL